MIQANELRIGNLVYFNGILEKIDLDSFHGIATYDCLGSYNPIPLTKEWLVRFGFRNTQIGLFEMNVLSYGKINIHIAKKRLLVELGTTGAYLFGKTKIQYVHQIQNLYFALTGQELKLNDK